MTIETASDQVIFSNVRYNEQDLGLRKLTIRDGEAVAGTGLSLTQNVPNPFAGSTTVNFTVPNDARVTVRIFDVMGREIQTLADATLGAGSYSLDWNGTDVTGKAVASGVYFCRIDAAGSSRSITMQVAR